MKEGARYVEVDSEKLMGLLLGIGVKVQAKGGLYDEGVEGREVVVNLTPAERRTVVRVYTSLSRGADAVRGCGEDAVRMVVGYIGKGRDEKRRFFPLGESQRIYRTAPTKLDHDARVAVFLTRFEEALREHFRAAREWKSCEVCGSPMSLRENRQSKNKFWGCTSYPECRHTEPA